MFTLFNNASPSVEETAAVVGSKDTSTKMEEKKVILTKKTTATINH